VADAEVQIVTRFLGSGEGAAERVEIGAESLLDLSRKLPLDPDWPPDIRCQDVEQGVEVAAKMGGKIKVARELAQDRSLASLAPVEPR
jgi:hypothetical protein